MKSFLYAAMAASLLMTIGCGQKKEVAPVKATETTLPTNDLSDDELLALLEAEADALEADADENEDEDDLDQLADLDEADVQEMEEMFKNMTPEQIKQVEQEAMAELARLIAMEQEKNGETAAMGDDAFPRSFDLEKMTPEEREQLVAWQQEAAAWASEQLELAKMESEELGIQPVLFAHNSADLEDNQDGIIKSNIAALRRALEDGRDVVLSGHAEENAQEPLELSQARAETLKNVLVAAGLDADHIHSTGYGNALAASSSVDFLIC
jgi:outer membrane protein OmpA-like peptidoglycan-associated protein